MSGAPVPGAPLAEALSRELGLKLDAIEEVAGGDINRAFRVEAEGRRLFVKSRDRPAAGEFEAEAAGLGWIGAAGAPVPEVLGVGSGEVPFLALEWIEPGQFDRGTAEALGVSLAALHAADAPAAGSLPDGAEQLVIGSLQIPLEAGRPWPELYGRVIARLADLAGGHGALDAEGRRSIEAVCERIDQLCGPPQRPSRLHGDLWSGNLLAAAEGPARLIDCAAYSGEREIDTAMLRLFGAPAGLLEAYDEALPPAPGAAERVPLYQLLPLLVHAVLFGGHYGRSAATAAQRYL